MERCSDNARFHTASEESPVVPSIPATLCVDPKGGDAGFVYFCLHPLQTRMFPEIKASSNGDCRCYDAGDVGQRTRGGGTKLLILILVLLTSLVVFHS